MQITTLTKTALPFAAVALLATTNASFASTVALGSLTSFTGGDAGEGLDLTGTFVHAYNLGGPAQTVQGVTFAAADRTSLPTGLTMTGTAANQFVYTGVNPGNANAADYGLTTSDNALEAIATSVWYDGNWSLDLAVTTGTQYKLQLILQEGFHSFQGVNGSTIGGRNMDISLEGALGLDDFESGIETNGLAQDESDFGMVYTYEFTATDDIFTVSLDRVAPANENVTLGAVTLEVIPVPEPSSTALLGLGGLALILRRRR